MSLYWKPVGLVLIVLVPLIILWYVWDEFATKGFAPKQQTENWSYWANFVPEGENQYTLDSDQETPAQKRPGLHLKYEQNSGKLLLKHSIAPDVYQYDLRSKQISRVPDATWDQAKGEITICRERAASENKYFEGSYPEFILRRKNQNRVIPTYGHYTIGFRESPSQQKLAVLSAYGPRTSATGGFPGLGGAMANARGQRYMQIMDSATEKYLDKPIRISVKDYEENLDICWSKDEHFVIVFEKSYHYFFVVEAGF